MASALDIKFPGNISQVNTAAELRQVPITQVEDNDLFIVLDLQGVLQFDPSSLAVDNGTTVIKPDSLTPLQAGRWLFAVDGFARGPQGPPGSIEASGLEFVTPQQLADGQPIANGTAPALPAVNATLAAELADAVNFAGTYRGTTPITLPKGRYSLTATLNFKATYFLDGRGSGMAGGSSAILAFPANTIGMIVQRSDTSGFSGPQTTNTTSGDGTIIQGMAIAGGGGDPGTAVGIIARARTTIRDVQVYGFSGDGIRATANDSPISNTYGNANNTMIWGGRVASNGGAGVRFIGDNANACAVFGMDSSGNAGDGFVDNSFLGNSFFGCHTASNGGASYRSTGQNARTLVAGCYSEGGQGQPVQLGQHSLLLGGLHESGVSFDTPYLYGLFGRAACNGMGFYRGTADNSAYMEVMVASDASARYILTATGTGYPGTYMLRFAGSNLVETYGSSDENIGRIYTGFGTTIAHGRSTPRPGVTSIRNLVITAGNPFDGRELAGSFGVPDAAGRANGEHIFNFDAAVGTPAMYKVLGGVLQPIGIVGGVRAAAQPDSTATTIAGVVADFNSLLAKLRAANLLAT